MSNILISDKKLISVFVNRFVPSWWANKYPKFVEFITLFLQWLEQNNYSYDNIVNYDKYFDIDKIAILKNSLDPHEAELGDQLIDQVYLQYIGDINYRYLSEFVDEIILIKNDRHVNRYKGTKYSFLFFFLLIMGKYFRIYLLLGNQKYHNGVYRYDGSIFYGTGLASWIEPFVYNVKSELEPSTYQKVMNILNPAGMSPVLYQNFDKRVTIGDTISNGINYGSVYMALYKDATFVCLFSCLVNISQEVTANDFFDVELPDVTFWKFIPSLQTGTNHIFYEAVFNTSLFTGQFNTIYLYKDVMYGLDPAINLFYQTTPTSFNLITGPITVQHSDNTNVNVVDTTSVGVMVEFT